MSAIFKNRKVPRHLIIEDDADRKPRFGIIRLLMLFIVVLVITVLASRIGEVIPPIQ